MVGILAHHQNKATFTHVHSGCKAEIGGFWHSRSATACSHIRGGDAVGSAISWGHLWFGACSFEADAENWELNPFVTERILLLLRHCSATAYVWTHVMICVEANFPPASVRLSSAHVWTYLNTCYVHVLHFHFPNHIYKHIHELINY